MKNKYGFLHILKELIKIIKGLFKIVFILIKEILSLVRNLKDRFVEKLRFSLAFKITFGYMATVNLILMLMSTLIIGGFVVYLGWNAEVNLHRDFKLVLNYLEESQSLPADKINNLSRLDNNSISIFDENRNILFSTEEDLSAVRFHEEGLRKNSIALNYSYMLVRDKDRTNINWQYPYDTGNSFGYAMVLADTGEWQSKVVYVQVKDRLVIETMSALALASALLLLDTIFSIIVMFAGARTSRKTLRPIETMTKTVENITINALDTRLDIKGSQDELKDLARTFNHMLDRIQQSYEQQNRFVSDASHELRTPISVIQGYANLLDRWGKEDKKVLEESISAIRTESENMKSLIEKLLFLARGDKNTQKIEKEEFYLNELVDEIIKETKLIDNLHEINSERNDGVKINADPKLLKEALRVFVDNSIKYTPEGGTIKINSILHGNGVLISIKDTGIGISKQDLPHIFDRFYRADKSRTKQTGGTGLGLAIAKWIILKHNGKINVESKVNVGTRIDIVLPLA